MLFRNLMNLIFMVYGGVLTGAVGGLAFANVAGFAAQLIFDDREVETIETWTHGGWFVGVVVALGAGVRSYLRRQNEGSEGTPSDDSGEFELGRDEMRNDEQLVKVSEAATLRNASNNEKEELETVRLSMESQDPNEIRDSSLPGSKKRVDFPQRLTAFAMVTVVGLILGALLGLSLMMIWFSLSYSPFSPADWGASIEVTQQSVPGEPSRSESALSTKHPLVQKMVFYPVAIGTLFGFLFGLYLLFIAKDSEFGPREESDESGE